MLAERHREIDVVDRRGGLRLGAKMIHQAQAQSGVSVTGFTGRLSRLLSCILSFETRLNHGQSLSLVIVTQSSRQSGIGKGPAHIFAHSGQLLASLMGSTFLLLGEHTRRFDPQFSFVDQPALPKLHASCNSGHADQNALKHDNRIIVCENSLIGILYASRLETFFSRGFR